MTLDELIQQISIFAEKETQILIAELEAKRFENQGSYNGHEKWKDNQYWRHPTADASVQEDKGRNDPLVDTGYLKNKLTTADNWKLNPKLSKNNLRLTIEDRETFTDSKYNKLDTGVDHYVKYKSIRGNIVAMDHIPARPFRNLSAQDINLITAQLTESIKKEFS